MRPPISGFATRKTNSTLHGRSVFRPGDVPGHNVFRGYSEWEVNGNRAIGDALDLMAEGGTPVVAIGDGTQTRHYNDATKREVVYLEGVNWVAVYAHINAAAEDTGHRYNEGEVIGHVRGDLASPHLHFELWVDGKAVAAATPINLRAAMREKLQPVERSLRIVNVASNEVLATIPGEWVLAPGGDHSRDQGKLYVRQARA